MSYDVESTALEEFAKLTQILMDINDNLTKIAGSLKGLQVDSHTKAVLDRTTIRKAL